MLTKMTSKQEKRLVEWRAEWFSIGSSTEPADRPRAERAITEMYTRIGKAPPQFLWVASPATAILGIACLRQNDAGDGLPLRDPLGHLLWDSLGDSLWDSMRDSLGDSLGDSLWDSLWGSLRASLEGSLDSLRDSLRDSLWDSMRDSLGDSLRDSLRASLRDPLFFGQHDACWIAYYLFASEVLGVTYQRSHDLKLWAEIAKSCGWWWPYRGLCIIADRPAEIYWDQQTPPRLHSSTGPALAFRDGYKVCSWHGTRVPAEWIEQPDKRDPRQALSWSNIEQRRALAEMIGWTRILQELHPTVVDEDPDPQVGTLLRVDLPGSPNEHFLKVRCGTGRTFCLPVPPCKTALEANASTFDVPPDIVRHLEART